MTWISVYERLPWSNTRPYECAREGKAVGLLYRGTSPDFWTVESSITPSLHQPLYVTHWFETPEPPQPELPDPNFAVGDIVCYRETGELCCILSIKTQLEKPEIVVIVIHNSRVIWVSPYEIMHQKKFHNYWEEIS